MLRPGTPLLAVEQTWEPLGKNAAGLVPLQMLFSYNVLENLAEFEIVLLKENKSMGWV